MKIRFLGLIGLAAVAWVWFAKPLPPARHADEVAASHVFDGRTIGGRKIVGFRLDVAGPSAGNPDFNPFTRVCSDLPSYLPFTWGSYIHGDMFTGRLQSPFYPVTTAYWYIPILGYPTSARLHLAVEIHPARKGAAPVLLPFSGPNPGETLQLWTVDLRRWPSARARVVLEDDETRPQGWAGVGAPIADDTPNHTVAELTAGRTDYLRYAASALALAALLFLPGLALRRHFPASFWAEWALLPLSGILLLVLGGLAIWLVPAGPSALVRHLLLGLYAVIALTLLLSPSRCPVALDRGPGASLAAWLPYAALVAVVCAYSVVRLPVTQEQNKLTSFQSRMVASPPDHNIPYTTAAYFLAGYGGKSGRSRAYFGADTVATRGPLAPFVITAALSLFDAQPQSPPDPTADNWPATADAFYLARLVGILTNALVVVGAAALALSLDPRPNPGLVAAWAAAAPVTVINTAFVWPKLFAAYFILLAAADIVAGRSTLRIALWTALASLAHPIGGLFAVPLFILTARGSMRRALAYAGATCVFLLPWLAYKTWLGHADPFFHYPLGGGEGYGRATSFAAWLRTRLFNVWYTLAPGAFEASSQMRTWLFGALGGPARWAVAHAKTLPGNLGFCAFWVTYLALGRPARHRRFLAWFVLPAFVVITLFWGFSADGLGRNCLEPLSVALIVWTAAVAPLRRRAAWLLVAAVAVESISVIIAGLL